jgi:streptogramin lyase
MKSRRRIAMITLSALVLATSTMGVLHARQNSEQEKHMTQMNSPRVRDIGIPVRSVNWVRLHVGRDREGKPCVYATMGQQGDNLFVLQIDPETGEFRQFVSKVPRSNYPTATFMSRTGKLYIGSSYAGHLLCFDPEKDTLDDLGAISPGASFPCRIDEDADGIIWIGSYGTADLTSYDPEAGEFTRYGRMDEVDMYNYPLVSNDGKIACLVRMTKPHVVVFDPETGEKKVAGPVTTKGESTIDMRRGNDGFLYITSSMGNFRIEGTEAIPVDVVPDPMPTTSSLPDGTTFSLADAGQQICRTLKVNGPGSETRTFYLDYETSGSDIFYVHAGPDECVYGSSILPLHLFRYNPKDGELIDLGQCSSASGEAYSMANLDGKMYISSYPGARISVYDSSQGYNYGDNPRDLGRIDDISYRPRSTLTGPLGRVWTASIPDYGRWGGPLSYYDPQTEEKKAYYRIVGDGSCYTLAHLQDRELMAVGTSISGGSGTQPKVEQAVLFLWDYKAEEKVWEGTLDRPVSTFNALLTGPDGRLYGTVTGGDSPELFVFDPESREFTDKLALPTGRPLDLGLQNGPDGKIYGFTNSCIYRLDPASLDVEVIIQDNFGIAGPILGQEVYFATGHRLRAARIFQ